MSALPPEADMLIVGINVCYVPIGDVSCGRSGRPLSAMSRRSFFVTLASLILIAIMKTRELRIAAQN